MLSNIETKIVIDDLVKQQQRIQALYRKLKTRISQELEIELYNILTAMTESQIEHIKKLTKDEGNWINWYIFANDCGKNQLLADSNSKSRKIKNTNDLMWLINNNWNTQYA